MQLANWQILLSRSCDCLSACGSDLCSVPAADKVTVVPTAVRTIQVT